MTYCISDIHGEYEKFVEILELIQLGGDDTLYIIGDVFDRGEHPVKTLQKIMDMPNVRFIIGNHELMAMECFKLDLNQLSSIDDITDYDTIEKLMTWAHNGSKTTMNEYGKLTTEERHRVRDYLENALAYEQLEIGGQKFLLVHSGLMNFDPGRDISDYELYELVWERPDYNKPYFDDVITVTGHTPTQLIEGCDTPGRIFKKNNHIVIDCGAVMGGSLACLRLDDMKEFYV